MKDSTSISDLQSLSSTMTADGASSSKTSPLSPTRSRSAGNLSAMASATRQATSEAAGLVKNRRLQLTRRFSIARLEETNNSNSACQGGSAHASSSSLGYGEAPGASGSHGIVANRRRQITHRLSMDMVTGSSATGKQQYPSQPKRLSACKSLPMPPTELKRETSLNLEEDLNGSWKLGEGNNRVAAMRERFNSSTASLESSLTFDSRSSLLKPTSVHSIAELSSDGNDDDESIGTFGNEESLHLSSKRSLDFQAAVNGHSSFNTTFLKVGGSGKDCRQTGKGSILVMADSKLAGTKVIQSKLNRAAKTIQRFFRYSMAILNRHREEVLYWQEEKKDIERRKKEELDDIQTHIELQKKQFALQLENDSVDKLQGELQSKHTMVEKLQEEVKVEKEENEGLKESIRRLTRENKQLSATLDDPAQADRVKDLQDKVKVLDTQQYHWKGILGDCRLKAEKRRTKISKADKKAGTEISKRKRFQDFLGRIFDLLEANADKLDPKLVKKIKKRRKEVEEWNVSGWQPKDEGKKGSKRSNSMVSTGENTACTEESTCDEQEDAVGAAANAHGSDQCSQDKNKKGPTSESRHDSLRKHMESLQNSFSITESSNKVVHAKPKASTDSAKFSESSPLLSLITDNDDVKSVKVASARGIGNSKKLGESSPLLSLVAGEDYATKPSKSKSKESKKKKSSKKELRRNDSTPLPSGSDHGKSGSSGKSKKQSKKKSGHRSISQPEMSVADSSALMSIIAGNK